VSGVDDSVVTLTLTGLVEAGVEHRSVVLTDDEGRIWQLGAAGSTVLGRRVRVVGRPRPDLLTTAQQGTPLAVVDLTVIDDR
jgi:hypothetical protein